MTIPRYEDHTDSVTAKLALLKASYEAGRFDVAMSLAESIKDGLDYERQVRGVAGEPQVAADAFTPVEQLPPALAKWARGWSFSKPLTLFETVDIARTAEPVDVGIAFRADQVTDVGRETRVARWDAPARQLREVRSQIYGVSRRGKEIRARLAFFADVDAHESAQYLVFFGNPNAQLPDYPSDLRVQGDGYGLDIANEHYRAGLSRQSGQLNRIIYAREHGLELYAGGKGHGEPPDVDWGHDYVDQGGFQKMRMRNGPRPPNYEVVRGPLSVQVRRWGFPYSPVHPIFTPSRVHMDVTYTFYAGLPYFMKQGRFDVVKDVEIEAMRDDEWVFSGYSFTDMVWIDSAGRLHEGAVPQEQIDALWGVGFMNRTSRDAFIALRLAHEATGIAIPHGGPPSMHYAGHGQLWSRYPASRPTTLPAGTSIRQKNAYLVTPYPQDDAAGQIEQTRHRLLNPLEFRAEMPMSFAGAAEGALPLARPGETPETAPLKPAIWKALREVRDEQFYTVDANVVDMGYVYDIRERNGTVRVTITMPHRGRPVYQFLASQGGGRVSEGIRERLLKLASVRDVVVDFTWDPPWTSARLSDAGRVAMGLGV
ncbi:MAG: hypothetical protein HYX69_11190 [Planctomycetia bacterium]|nr:hypothetical protein [Planctomycetia bacterium]